jgi:16S rRNA processing protein RimM
MTPDDAPAWPDDAIEVGRITGAWGIKGWIRVHPHASDPQALFSSRRWFLAPPQVAQGPAPAALPTRWLRITDAREQGDAVVACAEQVPDRNAAEGLKGARVFVGRSSFPTPDEGEYYWVDLIGLEVLNRSGDRLGTVADLIATGAHSVLRVVPGPDAQGAPATPAAEGEAPVAERLIPFVAAYVDQVDLAARRITVDWGLDY